MGFFCCKEVWLYVIQSSVWGVLVLQLLTFGDWVCFLFFSFLLIREIFFERKHFKASYDLTGAKREKHSGQREFQMNLCKKQLNLERLLCSERAGFSCLPSRLPFKRTMFLCLKAPALENAEISRPIHWKCSDPQSSLQMPCCRMSPLGCRLSEAFTEGAALEMRTRDMWHRWKQNCFKDKIIYFWNQKLCVWLAVFRVVLLPRAVCE